MKKYLRFACLSLCVYISLYSYSHAQTTVVDTPYEKGTDENGYPIGIWKYFDDPEGDPSLVIDYTQGKLVYLIPDTSAYALKINNDWDYLTPDQQPRFIGSMHTFYDTFYSTVAYPRSAVMNREMGMVYLYFEVDTLGKAGNIQTFSRECASCSKAAEEAFTQIPNFWLPAKINGKYVPASFIMPIVFKTDGARKRARGILKPDELPKAKMLSESIVEAYGVIREVKVAPPASKTYRGKKKKN